jgi:hypothetical protein
MGREIDVLAQQMRARTEPGQVMLTPNRPRVKRRQLYVLVQSRHGTLTGAVSEPEAGIGSLRGKELPMPLNLTYNEMSEVRQADDALRD